MSSYDFNVVFSPLEFQDFARDILQIREKKIFESFAEGKDEGIDGRYIAEDGESIILQAKRLKNVNSRILRVMRDEKRKMDRLIQTGKRVDRYILALSDDLDPQRKEQIISLMAPYIINAGDIITKKDFNNMLGMAEYQETEKKYYQLWFPSVNILNQQLFDIVNSTLLSRSKIRYDDILKEKDIFVETEIFRKTILKAQKNRVVIISGEPGVGKTTLAGQVALFYMGKYHSKSFIDAFSVQDLYTALTIAGKKVILYDDFWGSNGLDKFKASDTARELTRIISKIRETKDCILVITTREYILEQGLKQNEDLRHLVEKYKLECRITQYSDVDKLQIYYRHLQAAELTWNQTSALKEQEYTVIHSPNYNPRVLAEFFESVKPDQIPEDCIKDLKQYLKCPHDFWQHIFNGLSREAQVLFVMMAIIPLPVEIKILKKCYDHYIGTLENSYSWKSFSETMIELEKTVIRTDLYNEDVAGMMTTTFQNPSVKDFLIYFLKEHVVHYHQVLDDSCLYYAQYMEYLELLNAIDAPIDFYKTIFENAIESLRTDTIGFYDKYKDLLTYNHELDKYYEGFRTKQDYDDIGLGRYLKLIALYKEGCGDYAMEIMNRAFLSIMTDIAHYPEITLDEDLRILPSTIIAVYQNGICEHIMPALKIYLDNLMRNRNLLQDFSIKDELPQIWNTYVEEHKKQIADYLEKYFDAELCTASVEGDMEEFYYQWELCEDQYSEFQIDIPESLNQKIKLYDSWLNEEMISEETDEMNITAKNEEQKSMDEIIKKFENEFLYTIYPTRIKNIESWISQSTLSSEQKRIFKELTEEYHILWSEFTYDEESMIFLEKLMMYKNLPFNVDEAVNQIYQYILEKSGVNKKQLEFFTSQLNKTGDSKAVWSKKQLEELFSDLFLENETFLEDMVNAGILVNQYQWYCWTNAYVPLCIRLGTNKIGFYQEIQKSLFDNARRHTDWIPWEILYQTDPSTFEKYLVIPSAKALYDNGFDDLIDLSDAEYEFENLEITGGSFSISEMLEILEIYLDIDLMANIESHFSEEHIEKLHQLGLITKEQSSVSLIQLKEYGLLDEFGMLKELETFWAEICKWNKEI